ncbi:hypothetical protein DDZ14_12825 [Maritimibacter sp. 55A14]|uniref:hypothetical protein n=1 Tax=Maritimibacter sp. 55A14 TaxID=2174844 RepID=UPI000D60F9D5|nr:hypothetical protein [Maritimibacter sp. 55A14]PWE31392.1 hypothetical protein DDZ14_12825 [Maritimibacter sp. 55A14]
MRDVRKLKDKLDRLAAAETPAAASGRRDLAGEGPQELLAAILREIDDTLLGRELDFHNDRGEMLGLDVSGRRLLRVRAVAPETLQETFSEHLDQPISELRDPAAVALRELLQVFLDGVRTVTVEPRKLSRRPRESQLGCSADALATAWDASLIGEDPAPALPDGPVGTFLASAGDLALAWIALSGEEIAGRGGDGNHAERLAALAEGGFALPGKPRGDGCILLSGNDETGASLLYGAAGEARVALIFPSENLARITALWQAANS